MLRPLVPLANLVINARYFIKNDNPSAPFPRLTGDTVQVVILQLSLLVDGRPDVVIDLSAAGAVDILKKNPFIIKEASSYHMRVKFRVQHEVISGLRYLQLVKRKGIKVDKSDEMMVCDPFAFTLRDVVSWCTDVFSLNRGATDPIPPKIRSTRRLARTPSLPEIPTLF